MKSGRGGGGERECGRGEGDDRALCLAHCPVFSDAPAHECAGWTGVSGVIQGSTESQRRATTRPGVVCDVCTDRALATRLAVTVACSLKVGGEGCGHHNVGHAG